MAAKKKKKKGGWQNTMLLVIFLVAAVVFVPTTALLFVGMMPTVVARLTDRSNERTKVLSVGFMNFAGCFPYWMQLVQDGHTLEISLGILSQPATIVVMYAAAGCGYLIEWMMTGVVANIMVQKGRKRLTDIKSIQDDLVKRWGPEVTGDLPLDAQGFPVENPE